MRVKFTFRRGPPLTLLNTLNLAIWDLEKINHVPADVGQNSHLLKQETAGGHPMRKGECRNLQTSVGINLRHSSRINLVDGNVEGDAVAKEFKQGAEQCFGTNGGLNMNV